MLVLAGALAAVSGCDSQASQQAEAQRHLDAALTKLGKANAGYIAVDNGQAAESFLAYRQETMDAAFADLNKIMALNAPQQKLQALRLGAEIDASAARHAAREAAVENAALTGRATVLLGYVSAMEGAAARSDSLQPQTEQQLVKLREEVANQTAKRNELAGIIDDLSGKLEAVQAEAEQFTARANQGQQAIQSQ